MTVSATQPLKLIEDDYKKYALLLELESIHAQMNRLVAELTPIRSRVWVTTGAGHGTRATMRRVFSAPIVDEGGEDILLVKSAAEGWSFKILKAGMYAIEYRDYRVAGTASIGLAINSTLATTTVDNLAYSATNGRLDYALISVANNVAGKSTYFGPLAVGDMIWMQTDSTPNATAAAYARITKIGL